MSAGDKPLLSVLVIVHRMPRQAENTLFSLSPGYQRNVGEGDVEVVVVENASDTPLGEARAREAGGAWLRYFYREEPGVSPAPAINFGFSQCRADTIGLIIDGARMVTPRLFEHALLARRLYDDVLAVVPGYHLGTGQHHETAAAGHTEAHEAELLASVDWKVNGYGLFEIACLCETNRWGVFHPFLEANCLFFPRAHFEQIGGADERFSLPGGGSLNIHLYDALMRVRGTRLVVLAGEGTFHQYHGGVTTSPRDDRAELLAALNRNLQEVFGGPFTGMHREPTILGVLPGQAARFIKHSSDEARLRHEMFRSTGKRLWDEDP